MLLLGLYPTHGHEGKELNNPWRRDRAGRRLPIRAGVLQFKGDWPWLSHIFKLSTHASHLACFLCKGTMSMYAPLSDASLEAQWRSMLVSAEGWMRDRLAEGGYISQVFSWPGVTFSCIVLDWMHVCDLGISQVCLGNVLFEVFVMVGGVIGNPLEGMSNLMVMLKDAANDLGVGCPLSKITLAQVRGEDRKPRLKAKAAQTRHFVPIVLRMMQMYFPPSDNHSVARLSCLMWLNRMYEELNAWSEGSADRLAVACRRHLLLCMQLAREQLRLVGGGPWLQWRWYPKHHMAMHLCEHQAKVWGKPKTWWCYADESAIGMAADLAETVHPWTLPAASLSKWLVWARLGPH